MFDGWQDRRDLEGITRKLVRFCKICQRRDEKSRLCGGLGIGTGTYGDLSEFRSAPVELILQSGHNAGVHLTDPAFR